MKKLLLLVVLLFAVQALADVTTQSYSVTYACTGSTGPYAFTFPISAAGALTVTQDGTLVGSGAYTIVPVNNNYENGGSVTLNASCAGGSTLVLTRVTPLTQGTVFTDNMPTPMKTFERSLDKLTEIAQEQGGDIGSLATWSCPPGQVASGLASRLPQCVASPAVTITAPWVAASTNATTITATMTGNTGSPFVAGRFVAEVNQPGVFGYSGTYSACNIHLPGGICYGGSTMATDLSDGTAYTHTVGFNPQVNQPRTYPDGHASDVYGVAVGFTLGSGVWPGSGVRVEDAGSGGQVAVGYDMTRGVTPVGAYFRPSCHTGTCNSATLQFNSDNTGSLTTPSKLFGDFLGNLRLQSPAAVVVNPLNDGISTISANVNSSTLILEANGWNGSATAYDWGIYHNLNASGAVTVDHLEITPPSGLPGGVIPNIAINSGVIVTGQVTSTLATGTAPLAVASTTPVAKLTANVTSYNHSGTQQVGEHFVSDTCVLGTSCSVTFTGAAVFTSNATYDCWARDSTTAANVVTIAISSGSAVAFTGTGTDTINYLCKGH